MYMTWIHQQKNPPAISSVHLGVLVVPVHLSIFYSQNVKKNTNYKREITLPTPKTPPTVMVKAGGKTFPQPQSSQHLLMMPAPLSAVLYCKAKPVW